MTITIQVKGLRRTQKMMAQLPKTMSHEIMRVSEQFMRAVQKSAKLRAPRVTGFLAGQITLRKKGKEIILDTGEAYYAYYQEFRFTPHIIPKEYLQQHLTSPNIPGQFVSKPTGFIWVSKHKPFMIPALEMNITNLPNLLIKGAKKAIDKARK